MTRLLVLFFCFITAFCHSSGELNSIAVFEGDPSGNVAGAVNVMTGDFFISEQDITVAGVEPIQLPRSYLSSHADTTAAGWAFAWGSHILYHPVAFKQFHRCGSIQVFNPNGSHISYSSTQLQKSTPKDHTPGRFYLDPLSKKTALTNSAHGIIDGKSNWKNSKALLSKDSKKIQLKLGDGSFRNYNQIKTKDALFQQYVLASSTLPTGNIIHFKYNKKNQIEEIYTTNPAGTKCYASLKVQCIHHEKNRNAFHFIGSDGRTYYLENQRLKPQHKEYCVQKKFIPPEGPLETYEYAYDKEYGTPKLGIRSFSNDRTLYATYYTMPHTQIGPHSIRIKNKDDLRINRVSQLLAPVGTDQSLIPIHSFFYNPGVPEKSGGSTDVFDAFWNKTVYYYSAHFRLDLIQRTENIQGNHILLNSEKFIWGAPGSEDEGNLICRTLLNEDSLPIFSHHFIYDPQGNVTQERFQGNLTGDCPSALTLQPNGIPHPNSAELYIKHNTYSTDGRNLLIKEELENGKTTLFTYLPGTSLLHSKLILDHNRITQRQFYEYDADHICIKEILDDGSTLSQDDHTGVTQRRVKLIHPRQTNPFIGFPEVIEEYYEENNQLILLNKIRLTYNAQGRVTRKEIFDATGQFRYHLLTEYNAKGQLIKEQNAIGQEATYAYDDNGNKILSTDFSGKRTEKMTYDFSNRLLKTEEMTWDGITRSTHFLYDYKNNKTSTIDSFGNETRFEYNALDKPIATYAPVILDQYGNTCQPISHATYNGIGHKITETNFNGLTTKKQFNAWGKPTLIEHPDGTTETFIYHTDGTLHHAINQEGTKTTYTYDIHGRETRKTICSRSGEVLSLETSLYNNFHLIETTDPAGNRTTYTYDGAGRKIAEAFHHLDYIERTEYTYDTLGYLHTTKKGNGSQALITRTERDLLNRVIEEVIEDEKGTLYSHVFYEYDPAGNIHCLTRFVEGKEAKEYFLYDGFNRPITHIDALGHRINIHYNEDHINSLNQRVLQKITTDPLGIQTIETYDAHSRLVTLEKKNTFGEQITLEEMIYDLNGNLVRQISTVLFGGKPLRTSEIRKEYNTVNALITLIEGANSPEEKTTRYRHTPTGMIDQIIKPNGTTLTHTYDPLGRMLTQTSSDGTLSYTFTYNALGHLLSSTDENTLATTYRTYDARGRLLTETLANDLTITNRYDHRGRRTDLILHDETSIHYDYGPLLLHKVTRYTSTQEPLYEHTYQTFDTSGHLLEEHPIGTLPPLSYTYDPLGRTTALTSLHFKQQINTFDPVGNILESRIKTPYNAHIQTYRYDDLSQVIEEKSPHPHTHSYDSHYNRLTTDTITAHFNALNQLTSTDHINYTYDLNGNLFSKQTPQEETRFTYDALDRLLCIESPTLRITFTYDSFHRRLSKTINRYKNNQWVRQKHNLYFYDDQNEIGATTARGKIIQLRVLGSTPRAEIGAAIAIELFNQIYAPIHDLQGNVLALISLDTQQPAESYQYSAFKEESVRDSSGDIHSHSLIKNPWRFSSKRIDEETGLIYYGRRYYDPEAGRWISPDPLGYTIGMNLYTFVLNDPLVKIDLYGLEAIANQSPWWRTSISTGMDYATKFINTIGSIIYNTIYHCMPIPFIRQASLALTGWLAGMKPPNESSSRFPVGENRNLHRTSVIIPTGQMTNSKEGTEQAKQVSDQLNGERVVCVHNATHGLLPDCIESLLGKMHIKSRSVGLLTRAVRSEIAALGGVDGGGTIFVLPWSQGGITTDQVLNQLTEAERKMIKVRSIGSASLFNRKDMDIQHFVSSADPVPWTAPISRLRASFSSSSNVHVIKSMNKKFMPDHSFQSPTYQSILKNFTDEIQKHGRES